MLANFHGVLKHAKFYRAVPATDHIGNGELDSTSSYSSAVYESMNADTARMSAYRAAIQYVVNALHGPQVWLEIGPGECCTMTKMVCEAADAAGREVCIVSVEANGPAFLAATRTVARLNASHHYATTHCIRGYSSDHEVETLLREKAPFDVVISEILGAFAGSEAIAHTIATAKRAGIISPRTRLVPRFSATLVRPVEFDTHVGIGNVMGNVLYDPLNPTLTYMSPSLARLVVSRDRLTSEPALLEFYDFARDDVDAPQQHETRLVAVRSATIRYLMAWMWCDLGVGDIPCLERMTRRQRMGMSSYHHTTGVGFQESMQLRDEMCKAGAPTESISFTSCPFGLSNRATNWHVPLLCLSTPLVAECGDILYIRACADVSGVCPSYTVAIENMRTRQRALVEAPYATLRPTYTAEC
jgi:hypothetical protein